MIKGYGYIEGGQADKYLVYLLLFFWVGCFLFFLVVYVGRYFYFWIVMNKARRHELKMLKYKKRLKQLSLTPGVNKNYHAYRSHGKPCSCYVCSHSKYNRAKVNQGIGLKAIIGQQEMNI